MKICKDEYGYFILDDANQKVLLSYKGQDCTRVPTMAHLGLCFWIKNLIHENEPGDYEILVDNIRQFKAIKYEVLEYLIAKEKACPRL